MNKNMIAAAVVTAAALLPGAAVWMAGNANATPNDELYLSVLHDEGIYSHNGDGALIVAAHEVCRERLNGVDEMIVVIHVAIASPELSNYDAGYMVGAAEGVYCPSMAVIGKQAV